MPETQVYSLSAQGNITFTWYDELNEQFSKTALELCKEGATFIKDDAKRIALGHSHSGTLAKRLTVKRGKYGLSYLAYSGDPISWIVENGIPHLRYATDKSALARAGKLRPGGKWRVKINGRWVEISQTGKMPALHFMAQATAMNEQKILDLFQTGIASETPPTPTTD
jgi:hypothetical protein